MLEYSETHKTVEKDNDMKAIYAVFLILLKRRLGLNFIFGYRNCL